MEGCKIVAVLNRKGGVCKTTTTHNLGVALVQRGKRVLLVDCDTQRNLTQCVGMEEPDAETNTLCELLHSFVDVDADELDAHDCIRILPNGLHLIPSKQALSAVEKEIANADYRRECMLLDALEDVRSSYDYILLDCMASLGMLAVNVAMAADAVLLVSTPEEDSVEGLSLAVDFIQEASRALRKPLPVCGLLVCRVDPRLRKSRNGVIKIRERFSSLPLYPDMIPDRVCVADARNHLSSVIEYAPDSEPAQAYQAVCEAFLKEVEDYDVRSA